MLVQLCFSGERPNHRVVIRVRRDRILHLIILYVVACLACLCRRNLSITRLEMSYDIDGFHDSRHQTTCQTYFYPVLGFAFT